jgi:predicted outer membrane repeat protein
MISTASTNTSSGLLVTNTRDSGKGSLREAIENAKSGATIKFASSLSNRTITLGKELTIPVGKSLTIDGRGATNLTISGANRTRIFSLKSTSVQPTNLAIKNLTLANGYSSDRGGAIATAHQGKLLVENVTFRNNVANKGGGGIYSAFEGALTVKGSRFEGNKATAGNDERGAGAIVFWGPNKLTVTDSAFIGNQGINGGAINSLAGQMTIRNSQFINNKTTAAYYAAGKPEGFLRGYGAAVFADRASSSKSRAGGAIEISNSSFKSNQGRAAGGAVYLYTGASDRIKIDRTVFEKNQVSALAKGEPGNGGALVVMSNNVNRGLSINNSSFIDNKAANQGGGLWMMNAPTKIANVTFSGNRAESLTKSGNGGAMALYGKTDIVNATIANNYAGWVGGAIVANPKDPVSVQNSVFYANKASNGTNKWGIQQHTNRALIDRGNNIQYPPKGTNNFNDNNATTSVKFADPKLGALQEVNGLYAYSTSGGRGANAGIAKASVVSTADTKAAIAPTSDRMTGTTDKALVGKNTSDALTGDGDRFVFKTLKDSPLSINNFDPAEDSFSLSAAGFGGGLKANTILERSQFVYGPEARDGSDRIIYQKSKGIVFFDSDGTGTDLKIQIATLNNLPTLTNADITIST